MTKLFHIFIILIFMLLGYGSKTIAEDNFNFDSYGKEYPLNISEYFFDGNINQNLDIFMHLFVEEKYIFGYYYYKKNKTPIFLEGNLQNREIELHEYLESGEQNAIFIGEMDGTGDFKGTWKNTNNSYPFQLEGIEKNKAILLNSKFNITKLEKYKLNSKSFCGTLALKKDEDLVRFNIFVYSKSYYVHEGENFGKLKLSHDVAYFAWSEFDPPAIIIGIGKLFIINFEKYVFVYQGTKNSSLMFGGKINASGKYILTNE